MTCLFSLGSLAITQTNTAGDEKKYPELTTLDIEFPSGRELYGKGAAPPIYTEVNRPIILRHLATSSRWCLLDSSYLFSCWQHASMSGDPNDKPLNKLYGQYRQSLNQALKSSLTEQAINMGMNSPDAAKLLEQGNLFEYNPDFKNFDVFIEDKSLFRGLSLSQAYGSDFSRFDIGEAMIFIRAETPTPSKVKDELVLAMAQRVYDELNAVGKSQIARKKGFDLALMPASSVKSVAPELKLWNGMQPGMYKVAAYASPGEEGFAYLKGFAVTKNTPITVGHNLEDTKQYMGWSDQPDQNFLYHRNCTVYTGDWSSQYPARIELWFRPKNPNRPERKLVEATYMINGWER